MLAAMRRASRSQFRPAHLPGFSSKIDVGEGLAAVNDESKRRPAIRALGVINESTDVAPNSTP
jgi:hypothetical protein